MQRYLQQILDAAVTKHPQVQNSAMDILTFTIKQGLAHPLQVEDKCSCVALFDTCSQCLPTIVALETSPNALLSARANALHAVLHSKHASLVNMHHAECARKSFEYQVQIREGPVAGVYIHPALDEQD